MPTLRDKMSPSPVDVAYSNEQVFERCLAATRVKASRGRVISRVEGDE